ncbi:phosphoglucosamine mutase [candidate division MSBL1 archaeon SCGC-AAA261F17]|uniref:Phosphoglucosamine mutase n=1 Tax=candidate division MSBL1 archaeon SCGC-AAA261F17 TaxID=1698274 RepID=A0A133V7A0_9EURY|nr:phosphoglucosamine mutase [candidate division MSBL1 archaeon SCGC-AAA261F17]
MPKLFGTSGVRGIINEDFTPETALRLARALATSLENSGTIVIGKDPRTSSDLIEDIITSGLLAGGCSVKKLGVVPTSVVGFAARNLGADAGIMITASHNPPEYNGVKFFDSSGMAYTPDKELEIEEIYFEERFESVEWSEIKDVSSTTILREYMQDISKVVDVDKKFKVVVDCANGAASQVTPYLLEGLGCEVITLNSQLDGTFPGRPPEPVKENLQELCKIVKSTAADVGLAHDGDGDRIAAADENGHVVEGDKLLALASAYAVQKFGGKIVTTIDASKVVDEQVIEAGSEVVRTKVGDVSVAQEMESQEANFGGEPSGTWICGDVHLCPDGPLAGIRILEMIDDSGKTLSELVDGVSSYPVCRAKIDCPNKEKEKVMQSVEEQAPQVFGDIVEKLTLDGLRLEFEDGAWLLVRPSGTEPYIRVTAEADDEDRAKSLVGEAKQLLQ